TLFRSVATALGVPLPVIKKGVENLRVVPGRLERVANDMGLSVFVDYAHTPEALENVLTAVKGLAPGRLITIFGCGGDRDRDKRPMMGEVAGRLSDLCVLTSDNPRTEPPDAIVSAIMAGTTTARDRRYKPDDLANGFDAPGYVVEPGRRRAIALGLGAARRGDAVLVAGKGHETYQIIGENVMPFDDRLEASKVLERLSAGSGKQAMTDAQCATSAT
ncbi:MAG: UDP-N-acetylmuramoyl-L-alanyl-D-glutamate--2,6-diaminopimelate ligase, partial [Desulfobacterales bacterium]|nr:UDP-N-acetylmuramoyl-L-alanyl-D-glutamate--2,6-diaminopimelate ligase [Desulfobacterales bacterium]